MDRLLCENLNFGKFEDTGNEDNDEHSEKLETRWSLCAKVSEAWCNGEVNTLEKAQRYLDKLMEEM